MDNLTEEQIVQKYFPLISNLTVITEQERIPFWDKEKQTQDEICMMLGEKRDGWRGPRSMNYSSSYMEFVTIYNYKVTCDVKRNINDTEVKHIEVKGIEKKDDGKIYFNIPIKFEDEPEVMLSGSVNKNQTGGHYAQVFNNY